MLPSATEIVAQLGLLDSLVGRSHECDFPPTVSELPTVTFAHINSAAPSQIIDREVKERLKQSLSLYGIETERMQALRPDFVITQTQCDVCAVSLKDVKAFLREELGVTAELIVLAPNTLDEVWQDIRRTATALGRPEIGREQVASLEDRLQQIERQRPEHHRPRVAMIEWTDPLMSAGNWVPELVERAGGINVFGKTGAHSDWMQWEEIVQADLDILVGIPCGFDLPRTCQEMAPLTHLPGWQNLRAVRNQQVHAVDGNAFFNRPGPRLVESTEILAEILHPGHCDYGHRGVDWKPLPGVQ